MQTLQGEVCLAAPPAAAGPLANFNQRWQKARAFRDNQVSATFKKTGRGGCGMVGIPHERLLEGPQLLTKAHSFVYPKISQPQGPNLPEGIGVCWTACLGLLWALPRELRLTFPPERKKSYVGIGMKHVAIVSFFISKQPSKKEIPIQPFITLLTLLKLWTFWKKKSFFFLDTQRFNNCFDDFSLKTHVYFEQGETLKFVFFFMLFKSRL